MDRDQFTSLFAFVNTTFLSVEHYPCQRNPSFSLLQIPFLGQNTARMGKKLHTKELLLVDSVSISWGNWLPVFKSDYSLPLVPTVAPFRSIPMVSSNSTRQKVFHQASRRDATGYVQESFDVSEHRYGAAPNDTTVHTTRDF